MSKADGSQGALNRAKQVPLMAGEILVSMENFIQEKKEGWVDQGVVVIETLPPGGSINAATGGINAATGGIETSSRVTDEVAIDKDVMAEFLNRHPTEPTLTVGKVYQKLWRFDASNWHLPVAGRNRSYLLQKAIETSLMFHECNEFNTVL